MSKRQLDVIKNRDIILATPLPAHIKMNLRERVAVRSVADLQIYCTFIEELTQRHHQFYGHKKVKH